jgi:2-aminoadipate transaminase
MTTYDFAVGQTNPETFPTEAFTEAAVRAIANEHDALNRYPGGRGHEGLRKLMAQREAEREGVAVDPECIALTNGSMQAVTLVGQAFRESDGDIVITEEFTYSGTIAAYKGIGLDMVGIGMDEHGMRMDLLESKLAELVAAERKPRFIYTLTTYQNPTGTNMPKPRKEELISLAQRYDIPLVEDNCYGDVHFEGEVVPAMFAMDNAASDKRAKHVYIGSLSKIFAPGVRLGYLYAEEPLFSEIVSKRFDAGSNYFAAAVLAEFYKEGIASHAAFTTPALLRKRNLLLNALEREMSDTCVWSKPVGGLFLWVRLPDDIDMDRLVELSFSRNFFFAPGREFHVDREKVPYLRLAFGHVPDDIIEEGISVLAQCVREARTSNESRQFDSLFG